MDSSISEAYTVAPQSGSGAACTCVLTEYHYHDSDDFAIEVDLFSEEELTSQLTDMLQDYRLFHLETVDPEVKAYLEPRAKIAIDAFQAMFRGRLADEQFLLSSTEDVVLGILLAWMREIRPAHLANGRRVIASRQECSVRLMELTSELQNMNAAQQPADWPYIKKIRFAAHSCFFSLW
jgi:hypothetical protein